MRINENKRRVGGGGRRDGERGEGACLHFRVVASGRKYAKLRRGYNAVCFQPFACRGIASFPSGRKEKICFGYRVRGQAETSGRRQLTVRRSFIYQRRLNGRFRAGNFVIIELEARDTCQLPNTGCCSTRACELTMTYAIQNYFIARHCLRVDVSSAKEVVQDQGI